MNSPALIGWPWPGSGATPLPAIAGWLADAVLVAERIEASRLRPEVLHIDDRDAGQADRLLARNVRGATLPLCR